MQDVILNLPIDHYLVILLRLGMACFASLFIGIERQSHHRGPGIRTHMILCLGACGIMILSMLIPIEFNSINVNSDPSRIAAQVVSGIGFLGAGAIFRYGFNVRGLTTAASIWTISGIGLMFGAGFYVLAGASSIFLFFILQFIDSFESLLGMKISRKEIIILFSSKQLMINELIELVTKFAKIKSTQVKHSEKDKIYTLTLVVYFKRKKMKLGKLADTLRKHPDILSFEIR